MPSAGASGWTDLPGGGVCVQKEQLVNIVEPKVFLVGETRLVEEGLQAFLRHTGAPEWTSDAPSDSELLCEVMGRLCYRSFQPGLNPNVTRIREGNAPYLANIVEVGHGSVLEHAMLNFIFADVSRVVTHELVRHRTGTAISQESLRFVRLDTLSAYVPLHIRESESGMEVFVRTFEELERIQRELAALYAIDDEKKFDVKKKLTSAFRRMAPIGVATTIGWSCNFRTLRHVIEMRTDPHAEEEIRFLFGKVYHLVKDRYPNLFADYEETDADGLPWIRTAHPKI
jgi:thymidylate synthase (FAD)